jgi:transcription termination/antitermination protein NusA
MNSNKNYYMSDITNAIKQICDEKGLSYDAVIATIESALAAAYRKDFGKKNQNIKVEFDPETSKSKVYDIKTVVEDMPEEAIIEGDEEAEETTFAKASYIKVAENKIQTVAASTDDFSAGETVDGEEVRKFNPKTEMQITDAKLIKKSVKIGDELKMKLEIPDEY